MIVKMKKVQAVVHKNDHERLLEALQNLGVMHILPVNPARAIAASEISTELENVKRSVQILKGTECSSFKPVISPRDASDEVQAIQRKLAEYDSRLSSLHRQLEQQSVWGDITLDDLELLKTAGALPEFCLVPMETVQDIKAELVLSIGKFDEKRLVVAVISRDLQEQFPEQAELISVPSKDNPSIRAEAAEIDASQKKAIERLAQLAHLVPELESLQAELQEVAQFSIATNSALDTDELFAIQGWVPENQSAAISSNLDKTGVTAGIRVLDPEEDESPPTQVRYPRWAMPIKGLFDILNTFPGYRETDLAAFFMIAMPIFAAMLIGDGGYGLLFLILGIGFYRKLSNKMGREATLLFIVFGTTTLIWGILSSNFFGITPETMARAGGFFIDGNEAQTYENLRNGTGAWAEIGQLMMKAPLWSDDSETSRELLIQISFLLGCTHLVAAHLRRGLALLPDQRTLAEIGWAAILISMLGVIWTMFFVDDGESGPVPGMVIVAGLAGGIGLVVIFGSPHPNPAKRIMVGFASSLLPLISTFGDTMSYIRLMAVGMASYYIAFAFNDLGATIAGSAIWQWGLAAPIIVIGHLLNIILCLIAIFAHGVRLNMLEFSGNAGVQWAGYAYNPFVKIKT